MPDPASDTLSNPEDRPEGGPRWHAVLPWLAALLWAAALLQPWNAEALEVPHGRLPKPAGAAAAVMTYQRWGFICAALALTAAAMAGRLRGRNVVAGSADHRGPDAKNSAPVRPWRRGRLWTALGLLALFLGTRLPLMTREMTRDEQHDQVTAVQGAWVAQARPLPYARPGTLDLRRTSPAAAAEGGSGSAVWQGTTWTETLNRCSSGSNSPPSSLLIRLCHGAWQAVAGGSPHRVNLAAMRLPALLFGALAVLLLWRAVADVGGAWAGAVAALWLLVHPLFLSESVEARCYTLVLCLELAALRLLLKARCGGLDQAGWTGFHLCCAGLVYTFPGSLYLVLCLQIAAVAVLVRGRSGSPAGAAPVRSWLTGGLVGLAGLMAAGLPSLVSRWYAIRDHYPYPQAFPGWWLQAWHIHTGGFSWPQFNTAGLPGEGAGLAAWVSFLTVKGIGEQPLTAGLAMILTPALMLCGALSLARRGRADLLLLGLLPLAAAVLSVLHHVWFTGYLALYWYFIFALPGMAVLIAAGLGLVNQDNARPVSACLRRAAACVFLAGFAFVTWADGRAGRLAAWTLHRPKGVSFQQGPETWFTSPEGRITRYVPAPRGGSKGR